MTTNLITGASTDTTSLLPLYIRSGGVATKSMLLEAQDIGMNKGILFRQASENKEMRWAARFREKIYLFKTQVEMARFLQSIVKNTVDFPGMSKDPAAYVFNDKIVSKIFLNEKNQMSQKSTAQEGFFNLMRQGNIEEKNYVKRIILSGRSVDRMLKTQGEEIELFGADQTVKTPISSLLFGETPSGDEAPRSFFNSIDYSALNMERFDPPPLGQQTPPQSPSRLFSPRKTPVRSSLSGYVTSFLGYNNNP